MSLVEKIPTLTDAEVINLLTNARRLAEAGDERQQAAAAELLPALEAAAEARKADVWPRPRPSAPRPASRRRSRPERHCLWVVNRGLTVKACRPIV